MRSSKLAFTSLLLSAVVAGVTLLGNGCLTGGNEGDTCNPLVLEDECHSGLHCTQMTCTYAYCCPTSGTSNNPNCNLGGCPSDDAAAEDDAQETDGASNVDSGGFDTGSTDASDAADDAG